MNQKLNKNYYILLLGNIISNFGDKLNDMAFMWFILAKTNNYSLTALSLVISYLPGILFSNYAGILADKKNPKKLMIYCDLMNALSSLGLALCVFLDTTIIYLYILNFIASTFDIFFNISYSSLFVKIIDKETRTKANSMNGMIKKSISIFTPILAGFLVTIIATPVLFLLNSLSFLISAILEYFITYDFIENNIIKKNIKDSIIETFNVVKSYKFLFFSVVLVGSLMNLFLAPLGLFIPAKIKDILLFNAKDYGLLLTSITFGSIFSSMLILKYRNVINLKKTLGFSFFLQGLTYLLFGVFNGFLELYISLFFFGISISLVGISLSSLISTEMPEDYQGRIGGLLNFILSFTIPIGYISGGKIADYSNINTAIIICASFAVTCGLIACILGLFENKKKSEK